MVQRCNHPYVPQSKDHLAQIKNFAEGAGRDAGALTYAVTPGIGVPVSLDEVEQFAEIGGDQVIIGLLAASADEYKQGIEQIANELIVPLANS